MPNYERGKATFINPYNFVRVDWDNTVRENVADTIGNLSGVIECRLNTVTPIAIPDTENVEEDELKHKTYTFMKTPDGQLMIPGSSLRGAIRSIYEAVTDSCFLTSDENQVITRRAEMRESGKPYLLCHKGGRWELHSAERHLIIIKAPGYRKFDKEPFKHYEASWTQEELNSHRYGEEIHFTPGKMYVSEKKTNPVPIGKVVKSFSGSKKGYLYKGKVPPPEEKIRSNKHFESIFVESDSDPIPVTQAQVDALKVIYQQYNNESINRLWSNSNKFYEDFLLLLEKADQPIPVWYNKKRHQISLASIGRVSYQNRMGDKLSTKRPCADRKALCKACQLFGTANGEGKVGSRVRITDAIAKDKQIVVSKVTLKELGSPRISFEPFYIRGGSYDNSESELRGRKYYWHNMCEDSYRVDKELENQGKTKRNATMELVDKGHEFVFNVYFDRITENQLAELKWILTFGDNRVESPLCYKIGRGKPIGLGSVKITIDAVKIRKFDINGGQYEIISDEPKETYKEPITLLKYHKQQVDDIKIIANTTSAFGKRVSYPFIENAKPKDNKTAPHVWFTEMKNQKGSNNQDWKDIRKASRDLFYSLRIKSEEWDNGSRQGRHSNYKKGYR